MLRKHRDITLSPKESFGQGFTRGFMFWVETLYRPVMFDPFSEGVLRTGSLRRNSPKGKDISNEGNLPADLTSTADLDGGMAGALGIETNTPRTLKGFDQMVLCVTSLNKQHLVHQPPPVAFENSEIDSAWQILCVEWYRVHPVWFCLPLKQPCRLLAQ